MTTQPTVRRKWRWLRRVAWVLGVKVALILIAVTVFFGSGAGNPLLRRLAVKRINSITGGQTVNTRNTSAVRRALSLK